MSGNPTKVFKTGADATSYIQSLEQQKQKSDLENALNSVHVSSLVVTNDPNEQEDSLEYILMQVLVKVRVAVSVSFLNVSFNSWGKKAAIGEEFLKANQDKFSLVVIGNDLKLQLRNKDTEVSTPRSGHALQLVQIIEKDLNKLLMLRNSFKTHQVAEVIYEDFISKHSTNKYKMNLSFILRNSHVLELFSRDRKTYVRLRTDSENAVDMSEKQIWDFLVANSMELFVVHCLQNVLRNLFKPVNQGTLQCCFSLGPVVVDKAFLSKYSELFEGKGVAGVILSCYKDCVSNPATPEKISNHSTPEKVFHPATPGKVERKITCTDNEVQITPPYKSDISKKPYTLSDMSSETLIDTARNAVSENRSLLFIGDSSLEPIVQCISAMDTSEKLKALLAVRDTIDQHLMGKPKY